MFLSRCCAYTTLLLGVHLRNEAEAAIVRSRRRCMAACGLLAWYAVCGTNKWVSLCHGLLVTHFIHVRLPTEAGDCPLRLITLKWCQGGMERDINTGRVYKRKRLFCLCGPWHPICIRVLCVICQTWRGSNAGVCLHKGTVAAYL